MTLPNADHLRCPDARELIQSHIDDQIECEVTLAKLDQHLKECVSCRVEERSYVHLKSALSRLREPCDEVVVERLQVFAMRLVREGPPSQITDA